MSINKKIQKIKLNKFLLVCENNYLAEENLAKIDKIKTIIHELNNYLGNEIIDKIMKTH